MSNEISTTSVYVIGPREGPLKIGYAADPRSRLSNLQVGQAVELMIHYEEETEASRAKVIEKLIHRQLGHKRIRGEWFDVSVDDAIAEVKYAFIRWDGEENLAALFKRKLI
jgi:hypothetical protein